jgi:multidrug efflux pump
MILTRLAVTRPVAATVLSLLIIVIGGAALFGLPVREYPDIDDPTVTVSVIYPGAAAAVVEREVTEPIEEAVSGIDGVRQIRATSTDGRARVEVEFLLSGISTSPPPMCATASRASATSCRTRPRTRRSRSSRCRARW